MEKVLTLPKKRRKKGSGGDLPFAFGTSAFVWQVLFFYIPLAFMIVSSLFKMTDLGAIEGLTLEHFATVLHPTYFSIIANSLSLGLITAVLCLLIAFPIAHFMTTYGRRYKTLLLIFLVIPFWTNFLLHVCAWYFVLEREGFLNTFLMKLGVIHEPLHFLNSSFSVILMMVYYFLPFMVLPLYASLDKFDRRLVAASQDLGATGYQTFTRITLPILLPAIRAGFFLVFIPAFGEFVIPELMGGDKKYYVGSVVSQFMLGENTGPLGAAFTVVSSLCLVGASFLLASLLKRGVRRLSGGQR